MNNFRHMSNIRLVSTVLVNGVPCLMITFVVLWVVDYLVPHTSALLMWIEFLLYLSLHMWMVFTVLQKPYVDLCYACEELVRRMVRTFRA